MTEGKLVILGAVMKFDDKPFRARKVYDVTGVSRQLISYHLSQLVSEGYLDKQGVYYSIIDRDKIVDEMVDAGLNKNKTSQMIDTDILQNADKVNNAIKHYLAFKALGLPNAGLLKAKTTRLVTEAIEILERTRRYSNEARMTEAAAIRYIDKYNVGQWWEALHQLHEEMNRVDFEEWWHKIHAD